MPLFKEVKLINSIKKLPVLKLPRTALDNCLEVLSILGLLAMVYLLARYWPGLPQRIPIHFGVSGQPDGWGDKSGLFSSIVIGMAVYLGMTALYKYPHLYNYLFEITEDNAGIQYRLARSMVSWLKTTMILIFAYIEWEIIQNAVGGQLHGPGSRFLIIVLIFTVVPMIIYAYKAYRAR